MYQSSTSLRRLCPYSSIEGASVTEHLPQQLGQLSASLDSSHREKKVWRSGEDLNPRGTYAPIRFRVGRLQPGSATPPRIAHRLVSKNALSRPAASPASTPPVAATR